MTSLCTGQHPQASRLTPYQPTAFVVYPASRFVSRYHHTAVVGMEVFPHEGLHGVEMRLLPFLKLRQSLFQLLNLSIIEAVFLSSSNPTVDLFTLRYVQVSLWIFVGSFLSTTCCQNFLASAKIS